MVLITPCLHQHSAVENFSCSDRCVCKFNFKVCHRSWKKLAIFCSRCYWWPAHIPWDLFYCPTDAAGAVANGSHLGLYPARALGPIELPHSSPPSPLGLKHTGVVTSSTGCEGVQKPSSLLPGRLSQWCNLYVWALQGSGCEWPHLKPHPRLAVGSYSPHSLTRFSCEHHPYKEVRQELPFSALLLRNLTPYSFATCISPSSGPRAPLSVYTVRKTRCLTATPR